MINLRSTLNNWRVENDHRPSAPAGRAMAKAIRDVLGIDVVFPAGTEAKNLEITARGQYGPDGYLISVPAVHYDALVRALATDPRVTAINGVPVAELIAPATPQTMEELQAEYERFRRAVARKAKAAARTHGWCEVADELLRDLGLLELARPERYKFTIEIEAGAMGGGFNPRLSADDDALFYALGRFFENTSRDRWGELKFTVEQIESPAAEVTETR